MMLQALFLKKEYASDFVHFLLERGADLTRCKNEYDCDYDCCNGNPINRVVILDDLDMLKVFLDRIDPSPTRHAFMQSAIHGRPAIMRYLLETNTFNQETLNCALMDMVDNAPSVDLAKLLLEHGADKITRERFANSRERSNQELLALVCYDDEEGYVHHEYEGEEPDASHEILRVKCTEASKNNFLTTPI